MYETFGTPGGYGDLFISYSSLPSLDTDRSLEKKQNLKEGVGADSQSTGNKQMTEAEVYSQVAKLFEDHHDPVTKFVQSLLDAPSHQTQLARHCEESSALNLKREINVKMSRILKQSKSAVSTCTAPPGKMGQKRSPSMTIDHNSSSTSQDATYHPPAKKHKRNTSFRDFSHSHAVKNGIHTHFAFFDKVRKALRSQDIDDKFLHWVSLYTQEVLSGAKLLKLVTPFLGRFPELFRRFKEYIDDEDGPPVHISTGINQPEQLEGKQTEIDKYKKVF
ncbi:Paired amphipathic helix protein Sin3a [Homalodisca vitripennis]|nr:Paired amphipathic helix protein Sin3a [Homalodisca vitripennis]